MSFPPPQVVTPPSLGRRLAEVALALVVVGALGGLALMLALPLLHLPAVGFVDASLASLLMRVAIGTSFAESRRS